VPGSGVEYKDYGRLGVTLRQAGSGMWILFTPAEWDAFLDGLRPPVPYERY
jgi:hypothetical protein